MQPAEAMRETLRELGATFDHAAVAAPRIRDLLPIYRDLLGGEFIDGGDNDRVGYRALQLGFDNSTKIELMEPLAGSAFFDSFFARTRGGGLHHITFTVIDIDVAVQRMRDHGYRPTGLYLDDPAWREVFLHPRDAQGVLVQLAQPDGGFANSQDMTLAGVLAGHGWRGTGTPSP